jgi:hypothetical protein
MDAPKRQYIKYGDQLNKGVATPTTRGIKTTEEGVYVFAKNGIMILLNSKIGHF